MCTKFLIAVLHAPPPLMARARTQAAKVCRGISRELSDVLVFPTSACPRHDMI